MGEINAELFQEQHSIETDGLALVLFFKVGAEQQQHSGSFFFFFFYGLSIIFFFLTHYLLGWKKIGSSMVSGSPQRLLGAGESSSVRGRCIHAGTLPGCLSDQAAGALRAGDRAGRGLWGGGDRHKQLDDMTVMKMILWQVQSSVWCYSKHCVFFFHSTLVI